MSVTLKVLHHLPIEPDPIDQDEKDSFSDPTEKENSVIEVQIDQAGETHIFYFDIPLQFSSNEVSEILNFLSQEVEGYTTIEEVEHYLHDNLVDLLLENREREIPLAAKEPRESKSGEGKSNVDTIVGYSRGSRNRS